MDTELWSWAKYHAEKQRFNSVSEYLFDLIQKDKNMIMPPKEKT